MYGETGADPRRAPHAHASEAITTVELSTHLQGAIRTVLARPAIDAAMALDSAPALLESIKSRPSPDT
jgi:hypothetical protein